MKMDPVENGTALEVDICACNTSSDVATAVRIVLEPLDYFDTFRLGDVLTIRNENRGAVPNATDGGDDVCDLITIEQDGSDTYSIEVKNAVNEGIVLLLTILIPSISVIAILIFFFPAWKK